MEKPTLSRSGHAVTNVSTPLSGGSVPTTLAIAVLVITSRLRGALDVIVFLVVISSSSVSTLTCNHYSNRF